MTSSNGNIFRVNVPLWCEFAGDRWIPLTNASTELWRFLWSAPEQTVETTENQYRDLRRHWANYDVAVMICEWDENISISIFVDRFIIHQLFNFSRLLIVKQTYDFVHWISWKLQSHPHLNYWNLVSLYKYHRIWQLSQRPGSADICQISMQFNTLTYILQIRKITQTKKSKHETCVTIIPGKRSTNRKIFGFFALLFPRRQQVPMWRSLCLTSIVSGVSLFTPHFHDHQKIAKCRCVCVSSNVTNIYQCFASRGPP